MVIEYSNCLLDLFGWISVSKRHRTPRTLVSVTSLEAPNFAGTFFFYQTLPCFPILNLKLALGYAIFDADLIASSLPSSVRVGRVGFIGGPPFRLY